MDIEALSMAFSQVQVQQSAGVAIAGKVMDLQKVQGEQLVADLQAAAPSFGHVLDAKA
ncbi:MAG: YjfB family protein [Oscillospiraceae bacterium]|nr:YjfB family protein [Oscillospiraceae bacterium]